MALPPGTHLGNFKIVAQIGAGGMGEVYRARDERLGRDVAIKVLPPGFAEDGGRLRRFEQEAKALAALNNPNIVTVLEVGSHQGMPYLVMELLEGGTLRSKIDGRPLPVQRVVEVGLALAQGLAAAHEKGILHRDLKPENVFLTRDGRVKILDFGLAKSHTTAAGALPGYLTTETSGPGVDHTEAGIILGTTGYMSPEQVRGESLDGRSDLFALGLVLWEMVTGRGPFHRPTRLETLNAILREELPPLEPGLRVTPALERVLRVCLAKEPSGRFHSAHDLGFALEGLSDSGTGPGPPAGRAIGWRALGLAGAAGAMLVLVLGLVVLGRLPWRSPVLPTFTRVTFDAGWTGAARFTTEGRAILFSRTRMAQAPESFARDLGSFEARPIGPHGCVILAVSPKGEVALNLRVQEGDGFVPRGTLGTTYQAGTLTPKEQVADVTYADFGPDGQLAVVRRAGGKCRLEYPPGTVLAETTGFFSWPRIAPEGDAIAFFEHPVLYDDLGHLVLLYLASGHRRTLTGDWFSLNGMAWRGRELWFTGAQDASRESYTRALYAATRTGRIRPLLSLPTTITLQDTTRDGRLLLDCSPRRSSILVGTDAQPATQEICFYELTRLMDMSADGAQVVFSEISELKEQGYRVFLWHRESGAATELGQGMVVEPKLSPDGQWVAVVQPKPSAHPVLLPSGQGGPRVLPALGIDQYLSLAWTPGGNLLVAGREAAGPWGIYLQDLAGGTLRRLVQVECGTMRCSPDGERVYCNGPGGPQFLDLSGRQPRMERLPGMESPESVTGWSADSRHLFVVRQSPGPTNIWKLDIRTGKRETWRQLTPEGAVGVIFECYFARDGREWAGRWLNPNSDLYLVEGVR